MFKYGARTGSDDLVALILSENPPPLWHVNAVVQVFPKWFNPHFLNDDELMLEAFAKLVCTAGANHYYSEGYRQAWLSKLADLLKQRLIDDISVPSLYWVYYGRCQLVKSRDYQADQQRADILDEAIQFLSRNGNDADTQSMIGILKAEIYLYCKTETQRTEKDWHEIRHCFTQQGSCLDSQLHYALCLAKKILAQPVDTENYRDVLCLLGRRYLARFEELTEHVKTDLWWRECTITITDACVRTVLSLKDEGMRRRFYSQLSKQLREDVTATVEKIEAPHVEEEVSNGVVCNEDFD